MGLEDDLWNDTGDFNYKKTAKDKLKEQIQFYKKLKKDMKEMKSEYRKLQVEYFLDNTKNALYQAYNSATRNFKQKMVFGLALCVIGGYMYNTTFSSAENNKPETVVEETQKQAEITSKKPEKQAETTKNTLEEKTTTKAISNPENNVKRNYEKGVSEQQKDYQLLSQPSDHIYFVSKGDTLSKISEQVTGDMHNWHQIKAYNNLESNLIEVNQALKIPSHMAENKQNLHDYTLVEKAENFDGEHMPMNYIQADKSDTFRELSDKLYGTPRFADEVFSYNSKLNPEFSRNIFDDQYIYKPPKGYLNAGKNKK